MGKPMCVSDIYMGEGKIRQRLRAIIGATLVESSDSVGYYATLYLRHDMHDIAQSLHWPTQQEALEDLENRWIARHEEQNRVAYRIQTPLVSLPAVEVQ